MCSELQAGSDVSWSSCWRKKTKLESNFRKSYRQRDCRIWLLQLANVCSHHSPSSSIPSPWSLATSFKSVYQLFCAVATIYLRILPAVPNTSASYTYCICTAHFISRCDMYIHVIFCQNIDLKELNWTADFNLKIMYSILSS
jgi:hypothetical protein